MVGKIIIKFQRATTLLFMDIFLRKLIVRLYFSRTFYFCKKKIEKNRIVQILEKWRPSWILKSLDFARKKIFFLKKVLTLVQRLFMENIAFHFQADLKKLAKI